MRRASTFVGALVFACSAAGAAPASAAVSCTFLANGNVEVTSTASGDDPTVQRVGDAIKVTDGPDAVTCVGSGTVLTMDKIVYNATNADYSGFTIDLAGGPFAPGETDEPGTTDEMEFELNSGPEQNDHLTVLGTAGADVWRGGRSESGDGMNLNAGAEPTGADPDMSFTGVDDLDLFPGPGNDRVLLDGGPGFTGPALDLAETRTYGDVGDDVGAGGPEENSFSGGPGGDSAAGGAGADQFDEGLGSEDDDYDGGPGTDLLYYDTGLPVRIDLSQTGRQDTGVGGRDVVTGLEDVYTGDAGDVLIGGRGRNALHGRAGSDILRIRDGATDVADCGDGPDSVIADIAGVDSIGATCESASFDMRPDTSIGSGPNGPTRDSTPTFSFSSSKAGSRFECSLDGAAFVACSSPWALAAVSDGAHGFRVRSRDLLGALDLSPAARAFSVDTRRPSIGSARIAKRFRLGSTRSAFRYRLSENATVKIKLQRCGRFRRKRCRRWRRVKTLTRRGRKGANRNRFSGRIRGVKVRRGRFRATLTATDKAGNRSKSKRLGYRVVR